MVSGYEGFCITNKNINGRGVAFSSNAKCYGSYATSQNTSNLYNFYLDIFVEGATPVFVPSISANNINITYDITEGSIEYTINNGVEGGVLTASTEASWLTLGIVGETIPFTCSANEAAAARTATVTLTYTHGDNEPVTKDVTVTQAGNPNVVMTIAQARAQGTGSVVTKGVVTSCVGTTGYIQDATAAICVYGTAITVGDEIKVSGALTTYNGLLEITAPEVTVLSQNNTVDPEVMTIAEINASTKQGWLVKIEDATVTAIDGQNTTIKQGENTIVVRGISGVEYKVNDVFTELTGNIGCFNNVQIANPTNIEVQAAPAVPSITVSPVVVDATSAENDGTLDIAYENLTISDMNDFGVQFYNAEGAELTEAPSWIEALVAEQDPSVGEGYVLSYNVDANDGDARTAYLKVYALDDEANEVYSNLITITQAKYVEATTYTLATSITSGKHYVIASGTNGDVYAMGKMKSTNREAVAVTATNSTIALTGEEGVYEFVIAGPDANGNYTIYDESTASTGYLYAAGGTGSNHLKVQENKDANAEWSITFETDGNATIKAKMNDNQGDRNWMRFNNGSSKIFSCYASGQQNIYLYEKEGEAAPTETVHVTDAMYATYCSENALDFSNTGLTAYIAIMDGSEVSFEPVTKVPAYSGVLLKANAAGDFTVNVATTVDDVNWTDNAFIGVAKQTKIEESGIFVLMNGDSGVGFYKTTATSFTVGAHTAYIPALQSASRNFIAIDEATAIKTIESKQQNGEIYNLAGQRVKSAQKGLYIIGGKKVVIK